MSNDCSERCACALHSAGFSGKFHTISCGSMRPHRQPFSHQIQHACATRGWCQYFIDTSLKDCCYSDTRDNYFLPQSFCSETFSLLQQPGSSHSCGELFCINQPVEYWISSATGNVVLCAVCVWLIITTSRATKPRQKEPPRGRFCYWSGNTIFHTPWACFNTVLTSTHWLHLPVPCRGIPTTVLMAMVY